MKRFLCAAFALMLGVCAVFAGQAEESDDNLREKMCGLYRVLNTVPAGSAQAAELFYLQCALRDDVSWQGGEQTLLINERIFGKMRKDVCPDGCLYWISDRQDEAANQRACDVAVAFFNETAAVTADDDPSQASQAWLVNRTDENGKTTASYYAVDRMHDAPMPDYFVLLDADTLEVLAWSDPEAYIAAWEDFKRSSQLDEAGAILIARREVLSDYSTQPLPLTEEKLDAMQITAEEKTQDGAQVWEVTGASGNETLFTCVLSMSGVLLAFEDAGADPMRGLSGQRVAELGDLVARLKEYLETQQTLNGGLIRWSLEMRAEAYEQIADALDAYDAWDVLDGISELKELMSHRQALPQEGDMALDDAQRIAWEALAGEHPEEMANCPNEWSLYAAFWRDEGADAVWCFSALEGDAALPQYTALVNARTGEVQTQENAQTDGDRDALYAYYEQKYGRYGLWPIEIKLACRGDSLGYGLPGENDMPYGEALEYAKEKLLSFYPDLTREQLDAAQVWPYFYVRDTEIYGIFCQAPFYTLDFDLNGDTMLIYDISFSSQDGTVYSVLDPVNSGNG